MLQLSITASVPNSDSGLALSSRLQQSVESGQLAAALEKAAGYPVPTVVDGQNSVFLGRATLELGSGTTTLHAGDPCCIGFQCQNVHTVCITAASSCTLHQWSLMMQELKATAVQISLACLSPMS